MKARAGWRSILLAAVITSNSVRRAAVSAATTTTYCESAACWPSASDWTAFNTSVVGKLIAIDPPLKPCASSGSDDTCVDLLGKSADADWISTLPGGYAYPVFTQDSDDKICFLRALDEFNAFRDTGVCDQGAISSFGVAVSSNADIAAALAFAAQKNLQVVIKNTGHDLQGRSIASKYALMIWLHKFKGVEIDTAFQACASDTAAPAVIARGGARWGDVYATVNAANYHVVGGASRTVGAVGGWVQGGGHSFSSPAFGLGVDNVLKFTVVLVNGTTVDASPCSNPDLFWALRGGGGSTYGIVTSVAYKLHKKQAVTGYVFDLAPQTPEAGAELITSLLTWVADVSMKANDVVVGGYPTYYGAELGQRLAGRLVINGTKAQATALLAPLQTKIDALVGANKLVENVPSALTEQSSFLDWHADAYPLDHLESVGTLSNMVSRLIPMSLCAAPAQLVKVISDYVAAYPYFTAQLNIVTGGAVSTADADSKLTSVTPSWRDSCLHLVVTDMAQLISAVLAESVSVSTRAEVTTKVKAVSDMGKPLRDVAGAGCGAYFAESDYIEAEWANVFWGSANYAKLVATKTKYDPENMLRCHHCVESDKTTLPTTTEAPTPEPTTAAPPTPEPTTAAPTTAPPTPEPTTTAPPSTTTPEPTTAAPTSPPAENSGSESAIGDTLSTTPTPTTAEPTTPTTTTVAPTPASTTAVPASGSGSTFTGFASLPVFVAIQALLLGTWMFFRHQ